MERKPPSRCGAAAQRQGSRRSVEAVRVKVVGGAGLGVLYSVTKKKKKDISHGRSLLRRQTWSIKERVNQVFLSAGFGSSRQANAAAWRH